MVPYIILGSPLRFIVDGCRYLIQAEDVSVGDACVFNWCAKQRKLLVHKVPKAEIVNLETCELQKSIGLTFEHKPSRSIGHDFIWGTDEFWFWTTGLEAGVAVSHQKQYGIFALGDDSVGQDPVLFGLEATRAEGEKKTRILTKT